MERIGKQTIFTVVSILLILFLLVWYIMNMEPVDYVQLTEETMNSPEEMASINELRRNAFNYAKSCSGIDSGVNFEDIQWFIYPDREIHFEDENNYLDLAGWYDRENKSIWIAYPYRKTRWVNSHESLHALGLVGHGQEFVNCGLLGELLPLYQIHILNKIFRALDQQD